MAIQNATTEAGLLEKFRVSLESAENQPEIAAILAEYSLDTEALAEGRAKLDNAVAAFNTNKTEDWMSEFYAISRIALEDNPQLLESLGVFVRS